MTLEVGAHYRDYALEYVFTVIGLDEETVTYEIPSRGGERVTEPRENIENFLGGPIDGIERL